MVFLGLERPVEYGRQQIFDPTTAQMVLQAQDQYANALYRDYVRGLEDMKEFNKEYGNFITPILADQEWYNKNVIDKVRGTIQRMYDAGIDPTRSVQGRAAISQLINSIDVGSVNKLRSSRDAANEYIKNRGLLEAKGLYNADLEERYLGHDLSRWDTIGGGQIWDRTSPVEAKTLKELTESWYNNRTPEILTPEDVASLGLQYEKGYDYTGFADRHLLNIAAGETPGWTGSVYSDYFRDLAERKVAARGKPYTKVDVERQLQQDVATANREYKGATREANPFALDDYRTSNDIRAHGSKAAIDHYYKTLENGDSDGNGGGSGNRRSQGLNYYQDQFDRGLNFFTYKNAGDPPQTYEQVDKNSRNVLHASIAETKKLAQIKNYNDPNWSTERDAFLNEHTAKNLLSQEVLTKSIGRAVDGSRSHCVFTTDGDVDKLYDADEIVSSTLGAKGTKGRRLTDRSDLDKFRGGGQAADKLKMQFTNETYTAPITNNKGEVRMAQYQKVNLYRQASKTSDEFIGTKWYRIQQSAPTKGVIKNGKRYYNSVATTWDGEDSGDMQYMSTEAEHILHSTSEGKYNDQTRF